MHFRLADLTEDHTLAGRANGEAMFSKLRSLIGSETGYVRIDLQGIELLTSSYFLGMLPLWTLPLDLQPCISNGSSSACEEIEIALKANHWPAWHLAASGDATILGPLETVYLDTLKQFIPHQRLTASDLADRYPDVKPTAWNNRLAQLHGYGLLSRSRDGRRLSYCLPWRLQGASDG